MVYKKHPIQVIHGLGSQYHTGLVHNTIRLPFLGKKAFGARSQYLRNGCSKNYAFLAGHNQSYTGMIMRISDFIISKKPASDSGCLEKWELGYGSGEWILRMM